MNAHDSIIITIIYEFKSVGGEELMEKLRKKLKAVDNKSYNSYKSIKGKYSIGDFLLSIDHVQGDPFAAPSRISLLIAEEKTGFDPALWSNHARKIAFEDYLARQIRKNCRLVTKKGSRGSGKSGEIAIACNRQQILPRNAVLQRNSQIEIRMTIGLPANGRRISAKDAEVMFLTELPEILLRSVYAAQLNMDDAKKHVDSVDDQAFLRQWIEDNNYVAFIANGSVLPRRSGVDDTPLMDNPIAFKSPETLQVELKLPNFGLIQGMAIPKGITLIVGGGFHGKSTLLNALELGVYDHVNGDGREQLVTTQSAVKIRAEDGRNVSDVDISCFIDHLPFEKNTQHFFTENASGSTSQAANIVESISSGCNLLLIDEDTSASNFMIRDARMQQLVADDKEPITPLIYRIRDLYDKHGISSIIVMGGSGDYFSVADKVIMLDEYILFDVTEKAKTIAKNNPIQQANTNPKSYIQQSSRVPNKSVLSGRRGKRDFKFDVRDTRLLHYGENTIDLSSVEQLVDPGQTQCIAWFIKNYWEAVNVDQKDIVTAIEELIQRVELEGMDILTEHKLGNLAMPRAYEIIAAINRIRSHDWKVE